MPHAAPVVTATGLVSLGSAPVRPGQAQCRALKNAGYYRLCKAGDAIRTRDNLLGRQELCQLSYARRKTQSVVSDARAALHVVWTGIHNMLGSLSLRPQPLLTPLDAAYRAFVLDREAARCTAKTLEHYTYTLGAFVAFLKEHHVPQVGDIAPHHVRAYLVALQRRGLKDTTQHAHARAIRAWLNWLVREGDLAASPMRTVTMPRLEKRIPAPFSPEDVRRILEGCDRQDPLGARNYALVLALLDSGLRASELCALRVGDVNMRSGLVAVMGKGQKQRQVRLGSKARSAILRMLAYRGDVRNGAPLWATKDGGALAVQGLQTMLWRLGRAVGVMPCSPHRFRRTFALWCLRDGMDLHSLRLLMGHSDLTVLQRYLALAGEDIERAHKAHSPVDRLLQKGERRDAE